MHTSQYTMRSGLVKYGILAVLCVGGIAGGFYLSSGRTPVDQPPANPNASQEDEYTHRFPLTSWDVRDPIEAVEIACDEHGHLYLAWASRTGEEERKLLLTRSADGGRSFETPRAITTSGIYRAVSKMKGKTITRELKMLPHLAVAGGKVHLAWTEALADGPGVRTALATSTDQGTTFVEPIRVHRAKARTTFTDLAVGADGLVACSWLDNRHGSQQLFASVRGPGESAFGEEQCVHVGEEGQGVCPCCPTSVLAAADGTICVAFRNLEDGYRDIAVSVRRPGQTHFDGPFPVVPPTWHFEGCPHDGPSLALVGDVLHVAWMDAGPGSPRCFHAVANRADMKFQVRPLNPIEQGSQGNAKLFADNQGNLHAVWEESNATPAPHAHHREAADKQPGGREILYRRLAKGESAFGPVRRLASRAGVYQTRPSLTVTPRGEVFVAWSELDDNGKSIVVTCLSELARAGGANHE